MKSQSSGTFLPHHMGGAWSGGTVKRTVWSNVQCKKNHISKAKEYAELAKQLCPNIQIDFISKYLIDEQSGF